MSWRQVAMGLGRIMQKVVRMAAIAAPVGLLALPAGGGDVHYSTSAYADGLTAESSWEEIMKKPRVYLEFPMLNVGASYVTVGALCAEGDVLRIADARADKGARAAAPGDRLTEQRGATGGYRALRADVFSASDVRAPERPVEVQSAPVRYPVKVYRVVSGGLT